MSIQENIKNIKCKAKIKQNQDRIKKRSKMMKKR